MSGFTKVAGAWKEIDTPFVKVAGAWKEVTEGYVKVGGVWALWYSGAPPIPPGDYTLSPTSQSLGTTSGFAEFDTSAYRGRITAIWCQVSWSNNFSGDFSMGVAGRPSGNHYRNISNNGNEWNGQTINHRIDSWDAASLTEFNSGAAIGYTYTTGGSPPLNNKVSTTKLKITVS